MAATFTTLDRSRSDVDADDFFRSRIRDRFIGVIKFYVSRENGGYSVIYDGFPKEPSLVEDSPYTQVKRFSSKKDIRRYNSTLKVKGVEIKLGLCRYLNLSWF